MIKFIKYCFKEIFVIRELDIWWLGLSTEEQEHIWCKYHNTMVKEEVLAERYKI